jgi:inorganic triphosphatase YgiF
MGTPGASQGGVEEREVKLAVPDGWQLPSLTQLDGMTATDRGDERLQAVYWDTDDLGLARAGVGLRHRNGTWGFKGTSRREGDALVREEVEVVAGIDKIPPVIRERVESFVELPALHPIAELDTMRHTIDVRDARSQVELVHDRVSVIDGNRVVARFAEVEVEFAVAAQQLADRLVQMLVDSGAVVDTIPKYVRALRALGHDAPGAVM